MEPQKTRQCIKETPSPHLPQEIVEEILVRLPVKSLLRLKCVSKPWRAIISSDGFVKAHLEKSSNDKSFEHHRIILENSIVRANQCFLPSFSHEPLATAVHVDYPMCGSEDGPFCIIGSCDGVVCIIRNKTKNFILWNPSTRKFKQLPPIIDDNERDYSVLWTSGLGFGESNGDYKVFVTLVDSPSHGVEPTGLVKTYSLKTGSWKKVGVFAFASYPEGVGIYASGKLHWDRYSDGSVRGIVSFDLENEVFGTVEWPDGVERHFLGPETIDGCLCCISPSDSKPDDHADYWLLKENDSWHKFATIERPRLVTGNGVSYEYDVPSFVGANGDILCWNGEYEFYTVLFKKKDGFLCSLVRDLYTHFPPVIYFESLVGL